MRMLFFINVGALLFGIFHLMLDWSSNANIDKDITRRHIENEMRYIHL